MFQQCPASRRGSSSRGPNSPRWQLIEGRYKGNLTSEDCRGGGGGDAGIADTVVDGMSSPDSFDELSRARCKVDPPSHQLVQNCAGAPPCDEHIDDSAQKRERSPMCGGYMRNSKCVVGNSTERACKCVVVGRRKLEYATTLW